MVSSDASTGRSIVGPLTFAVSPDERARVTAISMFYGTQAERRPISIVNGIVMLANGVLQTLLGLGTVEHRTEMAPVHLALGVCCLVLGPLVLFGCMRERPIFSRSRLSGDGERRFAAYERGLTFDRSASLVPWSRVRSILDVGDAFIVQTTLRRRILPKRIFDDGGDTFWAYAASRIVAGGRMLVVPTNRRMLRNSVDP